MSDTQPVLLDKRLAKQTALIFVLAAPLVVLSIAAGYVVFEHETLANGWWMVRRLKWWGLGAVVLGALAGYWSGLFHQQWIAFHEAHVAGRAHANTPPPLAVLFAIPRAFVHFPFHGVLSLFAVMWAFLAGGVRWVLRRLRLAEEVEALPTLADRATGIAPIWFMVGPLLWLPNHAHEHQSGELPFVPPSLEAQARNMPRWLIWFPIALAYATQAVNEDSGESADPRWLVFLGTYWMGDYVAQWWVLRARSTPAPEKTA